MTLQVMVSYSWSNAAERRALEGELAKLPNVSVLVDRQYIRPGDNIHDRIAEMIDAAACVIVLLTPEGLQSVEVRDELSRCHDRGKRIIPVVAQQANIAELPWYLRDVSHIRYSDRDFDRVVEDLLAAVNALANPVSAADRETLPGGIKSLLDAGATLLVAPEPRTQEKTPFGKRVYLELGMRESNKKYVVCAHPKATLRNVAEYLAHEIFPDLADEDYEWSLVKDGSKLPNRHTVEAAGLLSGDKVLLLGNHNMPEIAPCAPP